MVIARLNSNSSDIIIIFFSKRKMRLRDFVNIKKPVMKLSFKWQTIPSLYQFPSSQNISFPPFQANALGRTFSGVFSGILITAYYRFFTIRENKTKTAPTSLFYSYFFNPFPFYRGDSFPSLGEKQLRKKKSGLKRML